MKMRNTITILIALFLASSIFICSAVTEACFCGSACSHALNLKEKANRHFPFHMRCPCHLCESCSLENGQALKAKNKAFQTRYPKPLVSAFIPSELPDDPSIIPVFKNYQSGIVCRALPSSPIYLQQLSLLI